MSPSRRVALSHRHLLVPQPLWSGLKLLVFSMVLDHLHVPFYLFLQGCPVGRIPGKLSFSQYMDRDTVVEVCLFSQDHGITQDHLVEHLCSECGGRNILCVVPLLHCHFFATISATCFKVDRRLVIYSGTSISTVSSSPSHCAFISVSGP